MRTLKISHGREIQVRALNHLQLATSFSHSLPQSLRPDCDLSQRSIMVLVSSRGTGMRCDSGFGLLAELPEAAYVSGAWQRIDSLARDIR
jgi:hypothetical protein